MTKAEQIFRLIATELPGTKQTVLLCSPAIKIIGGKTIAILWKDEMIFRLTGSDREEALQLEGVKIFCPRGEHRPIHTGIQIPFEQSHWWKIFAVKALTKNKI